MGLSARFEVLREESNPEELVIRDIGPWSTYKTITSDAEGVVLEMHLFHQLGNRRLLYYDSDGNRDELVHDGHGRFIGFRSARDAATLMTPCPGAMFHDFVTLRQVGGKHTMLVCKRCGIRKELRAKEVNP